MTYAFGPVRMTDVAIVGLGIHPFGRHEGRLRPARWAPSPRGAALDDAGIGWEDVDFAAGGSDAAGNADTSVSVLGLTGLPFINVKNGCATGGSALTTAHAMLVAGSAEIALVVGFDKHPPGAFNPSPEEWGIGSWYGETGLMLTTQFFAMKIQRYMADHGISESTLARVAAKAFENGSRNPNAWRRKPLTEAEVRGLQDGQPSAHPVHVLLARARAPWRWCWPRPSERSGSPRKPVYLRSVAFRTRRFGSFEVFSPSIPITSAPSPTTEAAAAAFEQAGIGPDEVDIAQLQDTESGAEVMHLAETGLCAHGEQEGIIERGETRIDGRLPVNTDGGCLAMGEPIGASGLRQVHEVGAATARRCRGSPGARRAARGLHPGLRRPGRERLHRADPLTAAAAPQAEATTAAPDASSELHVRIGAATRRVRKAVQQPQRRLIAGDRDGDEALDARPVGPPGQAPQEQPAHAASMPVVDDRDRELRGTRPDADIAGDTDGGPRRDVDGEQRLVVSMVDGGQVVELRLREPGAVREEPPIARLVAETLERCHQQHAVARPDRAHKDAASVRQAVGPSTGHAASTLLAPC